MQKNKKKMNLSQINLKTMSNNEIFELFIDKSFEFEDGKTLLLRNISVRDNSFLFGDEHGTYSKSFEETISVIQKKIDKYHAFNKKKPKVIQPN